MIDYNKLKFFKEVKELNVEIFKYLDDNKDKFKNNFRLIGQIQGSILSIGSNVCEGSKGTKAELNKFLGIALNSATELEYQLDISKECDYLPLEIYTRWKNKLDIIIGSLVNYKRSIK